MTGGAGIAVSTVHLATAAMGTRFELVLADGDPDHLRAAGEAALERIEELHRVLTRFESSSLIAHLRRVAPRPVPIGADLFALLATAVAVRDASGGAFDIEAGARGLNLDAQTVSAWLENADHTLDLGAIAKGFALDQAAAILRESSIERAFLHGGTSSMIGIGTGWRVALDGRGAESIDLTDAALGVSASRTPHVLDPRTGQVVTTPRRVAVHGPSATLADAWSTALLVIGRRVPAIGPGWRVWIEDGQAPWKEVAL